jgi:hypothetical protein
MGFTDFLRNEILDQVWGASDYAEPATLYIGLSTTTPADDGTNVSEPAGSGYARVSVTNNLTEWPAASGGAKDNANAITFPQATGAWGTVTHVVIYDASTGGNLLAFGALTTSKSIENGDTAEFAAGDLDITLS